MLAKQNILVIGANSRVAASMITLLAGSNNLYLMARNRAGLESKLAAAGITPAWIAACDFLDTARTQALIGDAWEHSGGIDVAIIAHGLLGEQIPTEQDFALADAVISTNFTCVVAQLITLSNLMAMRQAGKIASITSVSGDRGRPRNYTYGAAKGALSLYLQGLRSSLWGSGVEIYDFKLGPVDTPMTTTHTKDFSFSQPEQVAATMVRLLEGRRYTAYVPGWWRLVMWVVRNLPEALFQRFKFLSGR